MSRDFSVINLVLGLIGTITGIIAIFISYWTLRKQSPRLQVQILKCEHNYAVSISNVKTISFWADFQIRNLGDRGTTLNDASISCKDGEKEYSFKKIFFRGKGEAKEGYPNRWIDAHKTINVEMNFYEKYEENEKEQIECIFTLYHTHGVKKIQCNSQRRKDN